VLQGWLTEAKGMDIAFMSAACWGCISIQVVLHTGVILMYSWCRILGSYQCRSGSAYWGHIDEDFLVLSISVRSCKTSASFVNRLVALI
jgi:hypothetical protein